VDDTTGNITPAPAAHSSADIAPPAPLSNGHDVEILDIGELAATDTAEMTVIHPLTKMPTTWVWTFAGPGHPTFLALSNALGMKDRAEGFADQRAMLGGRTPKIKSTQEIIEDNVRRIAGRTLDFTPAKINGEDLRFSTETAHRILKDPKYGWLYTQIFNFLRDEDVFIKGSPTS
jgi:hypothetical protein